MGCGSRLHPPSYSSSMLSAIPDEALHVGRGRVQGRGDMKAWLGRCIGLRVGWRDVYLLNWLYSREKCFGLLAHE